AATLERAERYLECGVDALFIEALQSPDQMRAACDRFASRVPLLANMVEGGKTPLMSVSDLGLLGFRIVIFPGGATRAVARTLQRFYGTLKQDGTTATMQQEMLDFNGLNDVIGTRELLAKGKAYENGDPMPN
ncbi:MAG: isocitrate lyase/phosphoenolpyruvate mutase family protein, partial [Betaproteobacteria bacterium]|nr:isocitrate lyase/phosphoenolpyruvate mutase family protein [Betaproteobacteria bacterium]